jgi:hypothetical protein
MDMLQSPSPFALRSTTMSQEEFNQVYGKSRPLIFRTDTDHICRWQRRRAHHSFDNATHLWELTSSGERALTFVTNSYQDLVYQGLFIFHALPE